jgi:Sulfatase
VAQPLLDLIARSPEFLIAHQLTRPGMLGFVAVLVVLCPLLLTAVIAAVGLAGTTARALALDTTVGMLVALTAMQAGTSVDLNAAVVIPIACVSGLAGAIAYQRLAWAQAFASVLALAVIVVPLVFASQPDISRMLLPQAVASAAGASAPATSRNVPVVVMVFDEISLVTLLDSDATIDASLFPNLADLAGDGIWFRNATTVSDYTRWALPAILSGMRPRPDASSSARDHPDSIFSLLARTHEVVAIESVTDLCPDHLCGRKDVPLGSRLATLTTDLFILYQHMVLPEELKGHLPDVTTNWANFHETVVDGQGRPARSTERRRRRRRAPTRDARLEVINRFVERIEQRDQTRPGLFFVHSLLAHSPYWLLPSGQLDGTRSKADALRLPAAMPGRKRELWPHDDWAVAQGHQRQLLQLGFVDAVIGRIIARLKAAGMYDRSLVIVLSDHGIAFRSASPRRDFTEDTAAQIMRIPLILKLPAGSPAVIDGTFALGDLKVNDRNVETIDLVPTIADLLGIAVPWKIDGTSMVGIAAKEPATKTMFYDMARRTRVYDKRGPDLSDALQDKLDTFGRSGNPYRVPTPPRFAGLIGQPTDRLRIADGDCAVAVDYLSDFSQMNRDGAVVPFEFAGRFEGKLPPEGPPFLAVSINGTVRAVTRGWRAAPRQWLATPALDAWRNGANATEVFRIEASSSETLLRRCTVREGRSR